MTTINISASLKELREQHNMSQSELAHVIGTSQALIANIEAGRKIPSLAITVQLADALLVPLDKLVGRRAC